ncbi:hypothetical protein RD055328_06600 [Companilactobacillus sp. RD055328]|uniref:LysM peptidoglycan-binding domain-containing protein n=1 Tax=Companilactobacillus sp. RD055328 TaxID=2916634 RepID=UPI001FC7F3CD|nr:LysM domain-containing protein [Companilactobacillus sp. RD055328]GKQ42737.1 hypothetical protein RD055328_06600 [Companilactobacillus sp. RD055328]
MTEKNDSDLKKKMPDLPDSVVGLNGSVLPEDLEKLNLTEENKPWNKQFEDDLNEEGKPSRVAKNKKKRGVRTLVVALFAALVLLMLAPVINWVVDANFHPNNNGNGNNEIVANAGNKSKSDKSDSKKSSKKKTSKKSKSTKKDSSDEATKKAAEQKAAQEAAEKKAAEEKAAQEAADQKAADDAAAAKQAADDSGYYTVVQGDNPFRIAYNHNLSTEELYALNGLQPGTVLTPGMRLRVK